MSPALAESRRGSVSVRLDHCLMMRSCFARGEDTSDWLLTDQITSWPGTPADRGWRYLRQSLDRHDSEDTDYNYNKVVLETILGFDRTTAPPPWLIQTLQVSYDVQSGVR